MNEIFIAFNISVKVIDVFTLMVPYFAFETAAIQLDLTKKIESPFLIKNYLRWIFNYINQYLFYFVFSFFLSQ